MVSIKLKSDNSKKSDTTSIRIKAEENPFFQDKTGGVAKSYNKKIRLLWIILIVVFLGTMFLPHGMFNAQSSGFSIAKWIHNLQLNVDSFVITVANGGHGGGYYTTICKVIIVAVSGAAMGLCGAVFQGSLRNALASPGTLGVTTGCTLGATLFVLFFENQLVGSEYVNASVIADKLAAMGFVEYLWNASGRMLCAFIGGVFVVCIVLFVSQFLGRGKSSSIMLIVTGQIVATVLGSVSGMLQYYYQQTGQVEKITALSTLQNDAFALVSRWLDVFFVCIPIIILAGIILVMRTRIGLLTFSDDEARSMGIDTAKMRWTVILICTAITGIVTAFCGSLGLLGFLVPHITRKFMGSNLRYLIPASMLVGSIFLLLVFYITSQFNTIMNPINLFTSVVGAIAFIWIAFKGRRDASGTWI